MTKSRQVISDTELLSVFGGSSITCYRVDWTGLSTSILDSKVFQTDVAYDALNRISSMIYPRDITATTPDARTLIPTYNNAGALESVEFDGDTYVSHIAYNAKGQRLLAAFGNGIMSRYTYDPKTFRLLRQRSEGYTEASNVYTPAGNAKKDIVYEYDLIGNIFNTNDAITDCGIGGADTLSRDFDYDPIYRLLSANGRENAPVATDPWDNSYRSDDNTLTTAYTQNYTYDKLGNITQLQHTGNSNFTRNFSYGSGTNNKLSSITVGSTTYSFTYDACGNQLTETSSRKWEWDHADKPRCFYLDASGSITQYTQYLYDAGGNRVKKLTWKSIGGYDSISYLDGVFEFRTDGTNEQKLFHVMDNPSTGSGQARRIAMIRDGYNFGDTTPGTQYNLEDHLGSSLILLDDVGADVNYEEYFPFGETSFGSYAKKRYRYVGKERDAESGLYYYGARYYAAWTCRFISVDPLAGKYAHLTPYNYAGNKPIGDYDIDGMQGTGETPSMPAVTSNAGAVPQPEQLTNHQTLPEIEITATKSSNSNPYERAPDQLYGEKDPQFWMSQNNYNPEIANYVQTQNLMASESGLMKFCIWFNGIGSPMIANFGVGEKTTTEPKIVAEFIVPQKIANPQTSPLGNTGIGSNLKPKPTPISDGNNTNFTVKNPVPEAIENVTNRLAGLKDNKIGAFEVRLFGSRVSGENRENSDLDVLILTNSPELFREGTRMGGILESIKNDFKAASGIELDINVMSKMQYIRNSDFKKSVDANSQIIKR